MSDTVACRIHLVCVRVIFVIIRGKIADRRSVRALPVSARTRNAAVGKSHASIILQTLYSFGSFNLENIFRREHFGLVV